MINTRWKARSAANLPEVLRPFAEAAIALATGRDAGDQLQSQRSHSFSTIPHEGLTSKNETWLCAQSALMRAFKGKPIERLTSVLVNVRSLGKSEVGPFIYDFYKNQVLTKGMMIIKANLGELEGRSLIEALETVWQKFYNQTLNDIKLILYQIQMDREDTVEHVTLLAFRKRIVMKTKIKNALIEMRNDGDEPSLVLQQMFSILQSVKDSEPPSECDLNFEKLTALALSPYLGCKGLYFGREEPLYPASPEYLMGRAARPFQAPRYTQQRHMSESAGSGLGVVRRLQERRRKRLQDSPLASPRTLELSSFEMKA